MSNYQFIVKSNGEIGSELNEEEEMAPQPGDDDLELIDYRSGQIL